MFFPHLPARSLAPILIWTLWFSFPASAQVADPVGDTMPGTSPAWSSHDIVVADARALVASETLVLSAVFDQSISAFSAPPVAADALAGVILLDVDKNGATGGVVGVGGFTAAGVDWIVTLGSELAGEGWVSVSSAGAPATPFFAPLVLTASGAGGFDGFEVAIPWSAIGSPNGLVNFALAAMNGAGEVTDLAPNPIPPDPSTTLLRFAMSRSVPEPGTLPLAALALAGLGSLCRRRTRTANVPRGAIEAHPEVFWQN